MPDGTNTSSKPSLSKSPVAMPQGQNVSRPALSEISANLPPPRFLCKVLPKTTASVWILNDLLSRASCSGRLGTRDEYSVAAPTTEGYLVCCALRAMVSNLPSSREGSHMSECMSTMYTSSRPSLLKSNALQPMPPQGVRPKVSRVTSRNVPLPSL